jgi:site-specific recombinase XerD
MPRRSQGIYFEKDSGWWRCRINGKRTRLSKDKQEAERLYRKLMVDADDPAQRERRRLAGDVTVGECLRRYLLHVKRTKAKTTLAAIKPNLVSFEKFIGSRTPVCRLILNDATRWIETCYLDADHEYSHSHLVGLRSRLKRAFEWCRREQLISTNPFADLEVGTYEPAREVWTDKQLKKVLDHWRDDQGFRDLILFLRLTGARVQEARAITSDDVDMRRGRIVLAGKINSRGSSRVRRRVILLGDQSKEIVRRQMKANPDGEIFRNRHGRPWTANAISLRLRKASEKLGFKVCPKNLRHTWATDYLTSGGDLKSGAELMGHTSTKMMADNYSHLADQTEHMTKEANRVESKRFD